MTYELRSTVAGVDLVVTGEWSPAAMREIESGRADGLVLNYALGFDARSIDFIAGFPIRRLNVLARWIDDLDAVYSLSATLLELRVQIDPRTVIDLERLPELHTLAASWPQVRGSIDDARKLRNLAVPSYSEADLIPLGALSALTKLVMKERPRLRCLDGIGGMGSLVHLGIHGARDLESISALAQMSPPSLEVLELTMCRKIADITAVAACGELRELDLSEGPEISDLQPLAGLQLLERLYLYGSTKVADGDLRPIAGLSRLTDFRMQDRGSYTPSVKAIEDSIARRGAGGEVGVKPGEDGAR